MHIIYIHLLISFYCFIHFVSFIFCLIHCGFSHVHCCTDPVYPPASLTRLILPHALPLRCFVCALADCIGVLRLRFMHEPAYMLERVQKIPEIMQLIPVSCRSQSRLRHSVLYQSYTSWLSSLSSVPIFLHSVNPWPLVTSASADRASIDSHSELQRQRWKAECGRLILHVCQLLYNWQTKINEVKCVKKLEGFYDMTWHFKGISRKWSSLLQRIWNNYNIDNRYSERQVSSKSSCLWWHNGFACPWSQLNFGCLDFLIGSMFNMLLHLASCIDGTLYTPPPPSSLTICPRCLRPPLLVLACAAPLFVVVKSFLYGLQSPEKIHSAAQSHLLLASLRLLWLHHLPIMPNCVNQLSYKYSHLFNLQIHQKIFWGLVDHHVSASSKIRKSELYMMHEPKQQMWQEKKKPALMYTNQP